MTALAMDVRELSFEEIDAVAGGPIWLVPIIVAVLLGGCATTSKDREDPCTDVRGNSCPPR